MPGLTRRRALRRMAVACLAASLFPSIFALSASRPIRLTVSAAISLTESLQAIRSLYQSRAPNVSITFNLGASGILQQQIEQGAPVDIFISASPREMNALQSRHLILDGTRQNLLENTLVLISPVRSSNVSGFESLTQPSVRRIAMANPESVPAGMYARQTLESVGIYNRILPKIIFAEDVRQTLAYVETGNVDAGIVYSTEARLSKAVKVVAVAPETSHEPIVYPVAIVKDSRHVAQAEAFVQFLMGSQAQAIFRRVGFVPATHRLATTK
jgi:molybdate transport system substrate-binding protein